MVRKINKDIFSLGQKSAPAGPGDLPAALDLLDTLRANAEDCVGMAANMIGVGKCIIAFLDGSDYTLMFNPQIVQSSGEYEAEEGCLSLSGVRKTKRFKKITVEYQDMGFRSCRKSYSGFTAEIIQHEIDHCRGIII